MSGQSRRAAASSLAAQAILNAAKERGRQAPARQRFASPSGKGPRTGIRQTAAGSRSDLRMTCMSGGEVGPGTGRRGGKPRGRQEWRRTSAIYVAVDRPRPPALSRSPPSRSELSAHGRVAEDAACGRLRVVMLDRRTTAPRLRAWWRRKLGIDESEAGVRGCACRAQERVVCRRLPRKVAIRRHVGDGVK